MIDFVDFAGGFCFGFLAGTLVMFFASAKWARDAFREVQGTGQLIDPHTGRVLVRVAATPRTLAYEPRCEIGFAIDCILESGHEGDCRSSVGFTQNMRPPVLTSRPATMPEGEQEAQE